MAEIVRDRKGRPARRSAGWIALGLSAGAACLVPGFLGSQLLGYVPIGGSEMLGFLIGAFAGQYFFARLVPEFFVTTSQNMMFVATSPYVGLGLVSGSEKVVFPEGTTTPSVPFLKREPSGNVPLELVTLDVKFSVPGKDAEIFVDGTYQYHVDPNQAAGYVGLDDSTILAGITPMIQSKIAGEIENLTFDEAQAKRASLSKKVTAYFAKSTSRGKVAAVSKFEETYAIVSENVIIEKLSVGPEVQKARDSVAQNEQMMNAVAKLLGQAPNEFTELVKAGTLPHDQVERLYNLALIQAGKINKQITDFKVDGLEGLAKTIGEGIVSAIMATKK